MFGRRNRQQAEPEAERETRQEIPQEALQEMQQETEPVREAAPEEGCCVNNRGTENAVHRGENCSFRGSIITFDGNRNEVVFGDNCTLNNLNIYIAGDGNRIVFGSGVQLNATPLKPAAVNAVGGKTIRIGDGCLLSNNVEIHTSDYHGIYTFDGQRVNQDQDIEIGRHVWIGMNTVVLKGSVIPDDCIVGAGSVVTRAFREKNAVICGNPAHVVKERVFWNEARMDQFPMD